MSVREIDELLRLQLHRIYIPVVVTQLVFYL